MMSKGNGAEGSNRCTECKSRIEGAHDHEIVVGRPDGEQIKGLLLPTLATTIEADLEALSAPRIFSYARWRKDWAKVYIVRHI